MLRSFNTTAISPEFQFCKPDPNTVPKFEFLRLDYDKALLGIRAVELKVTYTDGKTETRWVSKTEIREVMFNYGKQPGLEKALHEYETWTH